MAVTLTKIKGPWFAGPGVKMATYQVAFDSSYPTGGEAIDLTGDFDYVYNIAFGSNDTLADNGYVFSSLIPAPATAITSSNVLLTVHWDPADASAAEVLAEFTNTGDLSAVGQLSITVVGK